MVGYCENHTLRETDWTKAFAQVRAFLETHTDCKGATDFAAGGRIVGFDEVGKQLRSKANRVRTFEFRQLNGKRTVTFDGEPGDSSWLELREASGGRPGIRLCTGWSGDALSASQAIFYDALLSTTGIKASANGFVACTASSRRRVKFDRHAFANAPASAQKKKPEVRLSKSDAVTGEQLLARIHADPSDDATRLVYADFLMERGDLRGELIALQCAPKPSDKGRTQTLLRKHGSQWLGTIAPYLLKPSIVFTRGFLSHAALNPIKCGSERNGLAKVARNPTWSTVESLSLDSSLNAASPNALIGQPGLRALREFRWKRGSYVSEWSPEYLDVDEARSPLQLIIDAESGDGPTHCVWTRDKNGWSRRPRYTR